MDNKNNQQQEQPAIGMQHPTTPPKEEGGSKKIFIGIGIFAVIVLVLIILAIYYLLQPTSPTERIRDVFIIVLAFVSLFVTLALAILVIQLARLINLLQNEIKPILNSTNETVSNLRGTTAFLSDNLVEPVMKFNETAAAMNQVMKLLGLARKSPRRNQPKGE